MALPKKLEPKENLEKAFKSCRRKAGKKGNLYIAFFDANAMKKINDKYGHLMGDKVIEEIAFCLASKVRGSDRLIRFGGDEFILFMNNLDETNVEQVIERIQQTVANNKFLNKEVGGISVSVGVAKYDPKIHNMDDTIHIADMLMYKAKKRKNHLAFEWGEVA